MGRPARIPPELTTGPFTLQEAIAAGLTPTQLQGDSWVRITRGIYVWRGLAREPEIALGVAVQRTSPVATFSGFTAAWLHGLVADFRSPVEMTLPEGHGISIRAGMTILRRFLRADEVTRVRGYRATTICRTLRDLSWRLSLTEAVVLLDAALHAELVDLSYLKTWIALGRGTGGIVRLRQAVEHAEPLAESPMESRLRMLLVLRGLPRPLAQIPITDGRGEFAGRLDLYYPGPRLGIEYDGATHKESLAEDSRRRNRLLGAGIRLLTFTSTDMQRPEQVAATVASHLRRAA